MIASNYLLWMTSCRSVWNLFLFLVSAAKVEEDTKAAELCCSAGLSPHTDVLGTAWPGSPVAQWSVTQDSVSLRKEWDFACLAWEHHHLSTQSVVEANSSVVLSGIQLQLSDHLQRLICVSSRIVQSQISSAALAQCKAREAWASTQLAVIQEQKQTG